MHKLKRIVEESDTTTGKVFDLSVQGLIVLSLLSFCMETLPELSPGLKRLLHVFEIASVSLFTAEYLLRLLVADRKLAFVASFFGLIDLAAILPFFLTFGVVDLRFLRVFRLLRLFRILKIVRYSKAIRLYRSAFTEIREELVLFFTATVFLLFAASVGIYYFENEAQPEAFASVFHAMWWSVATLTTVGYGDVYPVTPGGKFFTFLLLMVGLGIVAVPSGLIASALTDAKKKEEERTAVPTDGAP